jgi:hypothetical protein
MVQNKLFNQNKQIIEIISIRTDKKLSILIKIRIDN